MSTYLRRPGGNSSVSRIGKLAHYQTVLYEVDMMRFSYCRVIEPLDGAREADVWAYLEAFLVHYRNLLGFFGKRVTSDTDLTIDRPDQIWSDEDGLKNRKPSQDVLDRMRSLGRELWSKYENRTNVQATVSRYLQHCTTYRTSPKEWHVVEMMTEIQPLISSFEAHLREFKPATHSKLVDDTFLGGESNSTVSRSR